MFLLGAKTLFFAKFTILFLKAKTKKMENASQTENGAYGYKSAQNPILDIFWKIPSYRGIKKIDIPLGCDLLQAYKTMGNELLAKFLFYVRDARGGVGERNLFRILTRWFLRYELLCSPNFYENVEYIISIIPEYGRWDDVVWFFYNAENDVVSFSAVNVIRKQLEKDLNSEKPSLLAKWLPSPNSGKRSKYMAKELVKYLNLAGFKTTEPEYRKMLSNLRKKLNVVETSICQNNYSEINYAAVPSVANTYYSNIFLKKDEERRRKYLSDLASGKTKINSSVVFPHTIYEKVKLPFQHGDVENAALEEMWKRLPDYVKGNSSTLVVRDGSASMKTTIPNSNTSAMAVASALTIYFSERMNGPLKNKFITFSAYPQMVDLSDCETLSEKKHKLSSYGDCSNTNIELTFDEILKFAVENKLTQEEMPKSVLIVSDMEFDGVSNQYCITDENKWTTTLFDAIAAKYASHGYKLPKLVFWNVNSRTNTIPMMENELGVVLISGFSAALTNMVLSEKTNPYDALMEELSKERYKRINLPHKY